MVVQKTVKRMKESSFAEKIMASASVLILGSIIGFGSYLVSSFHAMELSVAAEINEMKVQAATLSAVQGERLNSHLTNHPDRGLGRRIDRHEEQMHE